MTERNETTIAGDVHPQDDDARRAAAVRDLLEQLASGWTVVSATVKTDERGRLHALDVSVEENVRLSPGQPQDTAAGKFARGDGDDLPAWAEDDLDPDNPLPCILPDDAPEDLDPDGPIAFSVSEWDLDFDPDQPIPYRLADEDPAPAAPTPAAEAVPASQTTVGPARHQDAADAILASRQGRPEADRVTLPTAAAGNPVTPGRHQADAA